VVTEKGVEVAVVTEGKLTRRVAGAPAEAAGSSPGAADIDDRFFGEQKRRKRASGQ
jgi:hypothetical protein